MTDRPPLRATGCSGSAGPTRRASAGSTRRWPAGSTRRWPVGTQPGPILRAVVLAVALAVSLLANAPGRLAAAEPSAPDQPPPSPQTPPAPSGPSSPSGVPAAAGSGGSVSGAAETAVVRRGDLRRTFPVIGDWQAHLIGELGSQVSGRVLTVPVEVGDAVARGAVLVTLDPTTFQLDLDQQQAALAAAKAHVATKTEAVAAAKVAVEQARVDLADAQLQLDRMQALFEKPAGQEPSIPRKMFDDAKTHADAAKLAVAAAEQRVSQAAAEVQEAAADQTQVAAAIAIARQHLDETTVRAPFAGAITKRLVAPGDAVTSAPATTLLELQDLAHLDLEFDVPQEFAPTVKVGTVVHYTVPGLSGDFSGTIERILPLANAVSRSYRCRVLVANPDGQFRPGQLVQIQLTLEEHPNVLICPAAALEVSSTGWQVELHHGGAITAQTVQIGLRADGEVEILSGLQAGDVVSVAASP
ncbi:MAG: efflux RND transporter periplasmic adaptor subunit [Planctomycetota bacterium]